MGLYRRKDSPTWWISFSVDGKQYRRSAETEDKELAKRLMTVGNGISSSNWCGDSEA